MTMKTITTTVTLHAPGKDHKPFKYDGGSRTEGVYDPIAYPPGTEVTLDEKEADAVLKRFGGEAVMKDGSKVGIDPSTAQPPKVTTNPKPAPAVAVSA